MKIQELKHTELQAVNGGSSQQAANTGVGLTIGTGSLLSLGYSWSDGAGRSYEWKLDIGKNIHIGTNAAGNSVQS